MGTEAEQELASLQAYFDVDESKEGCICVHTTALPTILYHYEDTLAEESENNTKGRHAPTRQAGLSEMLCVVGRLLLRKVLTSYQSSLEEEQNQQLLVRLVLSHFQAQALERQAAANMESLLEEDSTPSKSAASKRKLKKDRRLKRQEEAADLEASGAVGEVTWDEDQARAPAHARARPRRARPLARRTACAAAAACPVPRLLSVARRGVPWVRSWQELSLLTEMGWSKCMGSTCAQCEATSTTGEGDATGGSGAPVDAAVALALDAEELGAEAAEAARLKLQLSDEEWRAWEARKDNLHAERQRIREQLKQRFEEFCENPRSALRSGKPVQRLAAAY